MDDLAGRHGIGEGFGVVIVEVMEDTPAARAGMRSGDIVVAVRGAAGDRHAPAPAADRRGPRSTATFGSPSCAAKGAGRYPSG